MPIFNQNKKRVYLRRKSQRLQNYAFGGLTLLMLFFALNIFLTPEEEKTGQKSSNDFYSSIQEHQTYSYYSSKY